MERTTEQGNHDQSSGIAYRSRTAWPVEVPAEVLAERPTVGLWVPGAYGSVWDLVELSIPEDQRLDYGDPVLRRWLTVAAGFVNEHLAQRGWPFPFTACSGSVVWANCELAYICAAGPRGLNTESNLADFHRREDQVMQWCRDARDRLITPDVRASDESIGQQAIGYKGPKSRGWSDERGSGRRGW